MRIVAAALLTLALSAGMAVAQQREPRPPVYDTGSNVLLRSTAPYWQVGRLSEMHSTLCAAGRFNQVRKHARVLEFIGRNGNTVLGVAKGTGWNLYDPEGRAEREADYFFRNDGTTSCEVYYYKPDPNRPRQNDPLQR
ncbi:hypothetical protein [Oceanibaculum indicum]|uniref:Uncharacterized protein n=2 Tax=Oceanibaculum indicum TaxID=526216 RepID=K2JQS4_9PROT|nr:hypothetical protein [Oceanibaculum indicum]EKE76887.1 hypothetical protein P24_06781 [Oceanibaculum indicum P24]RKQ68340.1 hypothetical protein BCL74_2818 [Oceanibaculum indicum]